VEFLPRVQAPGPAFARLLARFAGVDALPPPPADTLSARLAQWIDWPQAVGLAAALDAKVPAGGAGPFEVESDPCDALGDRLLALIERDRMFSADLEPEPTGTFFKERYAALQQLIGAEAGLLRKQLRHRLGTRGGQFARLAAVDAAIEPSMAERERTLLAAVPDAVLRRFERVRLDSTGAPAAPHTGAIASFRRDLRQLLAAELDLRLQPSRALLGALRTQAQTHA
jgi:hypothetical protein